MLEVIDSWLEHIWLKIVKKEYDSSRILVESNLGGARSVGLKFYC